MTPSATETDLKVVKVKKKNRWDVKPDSLKTEQDSPGSVKRNDSKNEKHSDDINPDSLKKDQDCSPTQMSSTAIMCDQCGKSFNKKQNYDRHLKFAHKLTPSGEPVPKTERLSFTCALCNKDMSHKGTLLRHLQWTHPEVVGGNTLVKPFKCEVENCTFQTKHHYNLFRHKARVHSPEKSAAAVDKTFYQCSLCPKKFGVLRNLRFHERKSHKVGDVAFQIKRQCPLCQFVSNSHDKKEIHDHFEKEHNIPMEWENFQFKSIDEFLTWQKETEKRTVTSFIRSCISPKLLTFQCRRCGTYKKKGLDKRRLKLSGSCKINGFCPAMIHVKALDDNSVEVTYLSTHVGHKNDPEHVRPTPEEREALKAEKKKRIEKNRNCQRVKAKKTPQVKQNTQMEMAKLMIEVQEEMADECSQISPQTIYIEHVGGVPAEECLALHNVENCQIIQHATVENCQIIQQGAVENCQIIQQGTVENCQITVLTRLDEAVESCYNLQEEKNKFLEDFIRCINESVASLEDLEYVKQHCQAILPSLRGTEGS